MPSEETKAVTKTSSPYLLFLTQGPSSSRDERRHDPLWAKHTASSNVSAGLFAGFQLMMLVVFWARTSLSRARRFYARCGRTGLPSLYIVLIVLSDTRHATRGLMVQTRLPLLLPPLWRAVSKALPNWSTEINRRNYDSQSPIDLLRITLHRQINHVHNFVFGLPRKKGSKYSV